MSDEELERLRQIECSNFEVDIVDKAVITIKKMQQEKQELIKWLKDNIKKFCTSNEWGKYYEISSCRNHILDILKEVE